MFVIIEWIHSSASLNTNPSLLSLDLTGAAFLNYESKLGGGGGSSTLPLLTGVQEDRKKQ